MVICADLEMRATNGPCSELMMLRIRGNASTKTLAISPPRRLPAVRTNTLEVLARNAAISKGRYLSRWSLVSTTQPHCPTVRSHTQSSSSRVKWSS